MIFVGDIALPIQGSITLEGLPSELFSKQWVGNLEGSIVSNEVNSSTGLFNNENAIDQLIDELPFMAFTLANNHILDLGQSKLKNTLDYLRKKQIEHCGAGQNLSAAARPLKTQEGDQTIIILNFGWSVIQCEPAGVNKPGVNPLTKKHVIDSVKKALRENSDACVVPIMHWNYELEAEPQPFERELAKHLIDLGVAGVIGAHAHRVGGIEIYKGRPIVYSLGNWHFKQGYFKEGRVRFPEFCNLQLAFEWDFQKNDFKFHFFQFDPEKSILSYSHTESSGGELVSSLTPFLGLSDTDYKRWYKKNHHHRHKGLPIYYWADSAFTVTAKNQLNLCRDWLVGCIQSLKR
jgi:poly-gamma-glutamate synthesis protein (capsule biosynthesis protein)